VSYLVHAFPVSLDPDNPCSISLPKGARIVGAYGPEHGAGHATAQLVALSCTENPGEERRRFVAVKLGSTIETTVRAERFQLIGLVHAIRPGGISLPWVIMEVSA
jgi:hypothetical protein